MTNILIYGKDIYLRKAIRKRIDGDSPLNIENKDCGDYQTLTKNISENKNYVVLFILDGREIDIPRLLAPVTSAHIDVLCVIPDDDDLVKTLTIYCYRFIKLPLNIEELTQEIKIIREKRQKIFTGEGYYNDNESYINHNSENNKEDFPYKNGIVVVDAYSIVIVEACDKKSILKFIGRMPQLTDLTLEEMILRLNKYDIFRANRSQAINFNKVSDVNYSYGGCFTMTNHLEVFVTEKYKDIIHHYNTFVASHRKQ